MTSLGVAVISVAMSGSLIDWSFGEIFLCGLSDWVSLVVILFDWTRVRRALWCSILSSS